MSYKPIKIIQYPEYQHRSDDETRLDLLHEPDLGSKDTVKQDNCNFVLQIPIAKELYKDAEYNVGEEFTYLMTEHFRNLNYTAVTCEPDDFSTRYSLRQKRYKRRIKVALVITMYNEDDSLFVKSLLAVQKNIAYLCSSKCPYVSYILLLVMGGKWMERIRSCYCIGWR